MDLNVVMTSLMFGAALLRRSGDGSEIRRGNTWRLSNRNPGARATEGSNPSLRSFYYKMVSLSVGKGDGSILTLASDFHIGLQQHISGTSHTQKCKGVF